MSHPESPAPEVLKADLFGRVERHADGAGGWVVVRHTQGSAWWVRPLARWLARREVRALRQLLAVEGVPQLRDSGRGVVQRSWLEGRPMQEARPADREYYRQARRLVARLHRRGVAHNDLAKEPNWLVTPAGRPALVDFQLAMVSRRRGPLFRLLAREDLRHLLKHKRTYCARALTPRELGILAHPSWPSRLWRVSVKRLYRWITRGVLGWQDREGAGDRTPRGERTP